VLFASYMRDGIVENCPPEPPAEGYRFSRNRLELITPVMIEGKLSGTIYLVQDLEEMYTSLFHYAWTVGLVLLVSIIVALGLAIGLQGIISDPILELTIAARAITEHKNYSVRAVKHRHDEIGLLVTAFNDMLEQIQVRDEALKHAHDELEQRVLDRTAELEAANKELEAFSYSISHDLRAPLRAVDGYAGILLEDYAPRLDADGKRVCTVICESARRMGRLIDDLLAFARVGRTAIHLSTVDMAAMAQSIFLEVTTPESRARIDFNVGPLPGVAGDQALIRQVWINLLSNAVKFSSKKERAVIEVRAAQSENGVVYSVRDNGAGFEMQYIDKLFGVFQRLHSAKEFEGTGCGLAIVQRIIKRHGGRIWAEAETGKGATFHFIVNSGD